MKKRKYVSRILSGVILSLCIIFAPMTAIFSMAAISSSPVAGQSNVYGYTGSGTEWVVPVTGYYDIECRGAAGGTAGGGAGRTNQYGSGSEAISIYAPAKGDSICSRVLLKKGTVLKIYVGGIGGNGSASDMYSGSGGSGGYPDGRAGVYADHWGGCKNEYDGPAHCAWVGTGGSGGSSYVESGGRRIISAQGGNGGNALMSTCNLPNKVAPASVGGGSTALSDANGVVWKQNELKRIENNSNSGNGSVSITYVKLHYDYSQYPATQTVKEYSSFSLGVETTEAPVSYKWQVSSNGGSSWNNMTDNNIYQGTGTKRLTINKIPYEYNNYLYRCVTVFDGNTYNSAAAVITVESGLVFDTQPLHTSKIEEQEITLNAGSAYADQYGRYQWQIKEPNGGWVDITDTDKYSGINTANLSWECTLEDNHAVYRCVISTLDGKRAMESNAATVSVIKKDFNKILAQYNQKIEYGDSLDINDVYVSVQYTNGKVDLASGWSNLYYLIDGERKRIWTPDQLGTQTIMVVFVDDTRPDKETEYEARLDVTVVDTTAPTITKCDISEHDINNDPSVTQTITVVAEAEDLYTKKDKLLYALVDASRIPISSDWIMAATSHDVVFTLQLNQNKEYILYAKDENGNIAKQNVSISVLDVTAPTIDEIYLLMTEREWYSYNVLKIDANDDYRPEKLQYRIALSDEELSAEEWRNENEFYIDRNGTYIVEVKDSVGNKARATYKVTNIDSTAPTVEGAVKYDYETDSFILSAKISDSDSGLYSYQKMNQPLVYLGEDTTPGAVYQVEFSPVLYEDFKNAIVLEVSDRAGNTNFYSFMKNDDEYLTPVVSLTRMTEETGEWLNHVMIKATYSLEHGSVTDKPYSFVKWDGSTAPSSAGAWTSNSTYSVTSSGKYRCFVKTISGAVGYADIVISDVDANPPEIVFQEMDWNWTNKSAILHYTVTDTDSGIARITVQANSLEGNKTYDEYYGMKMAEIEESVTLHANAVYSLYAYDIAGHESTYRVSCNSSGQLVNHSVTAIFVDYDDSVISTQIITQGGNATAPEEPTRSGYIFKGWNAPLVNITEDTTIKAIYAAALSSSYTVTFKDFNGVILKTQTVEAGRSAIAPQTPEREGYTFCGWDASYENITKNVTCTAIYQNKADGNKISGNRSEKKEEDQTEIYTVIFKDYDGIVLKTQTVKKGKDATAPENPGREGYIFRGWNDSFRNVTEDTICTAVYEKISVADEETRPVPLKTSSNTYGNGSTNGGQMISSEEYNEDNFEESVLEEEKYISVAMMQIKASELAVDNEEYGLLAKDTDEQPVVVESDVHIEEVTQENRENGNRSIGFWLVVIGLAGFLGFTVFYNLNRKYTWVNLPDIPVLNFDLPFSS